jgi:hypothetical protein
MAEDVDFTASTVWICYAVNISQEHMKMPKEI